MIQNDSTAALRPSATLRLLIAAGLVVLFTLSTTSAGPQLLAQDAPDTEEATDDAPAADENAIPPIPRPAFEDAEVGEAFVEALGLIESRDYKKAKSALRKIKRKGSTDEETAAIERALLEAEGGVECEDVAKQIGRGKYRKALKMLDKVEGDFPETFAGERLTELREECRDALFFVIDDFEPADDGKSDEEESDGDGGGDEEPDPGDIARRFLGGETGYGEDTKWETGEAGKEVFSGKRALRWKADGGLSWISFESMPETFEEYRWLYFTIRSAPGESAASLRLLFDCEAVPIRGGRGGRMARGLLFNRTGWLGQAECGTRWGEVRIDLKKLQKNGDARWDEVKALRLVHTGSQTARMIIDEVRLERE